jgi:PAS domain S-box-containing protein
MSTGNTEIRSSAAACGVAWDGVVESSKDVIYILSTAGQIIEGNQSFFTMLKRDRQEVVGARMMDYITSDDHKVYSRVLRSIVEQRRTERTTRTFKSSQGQTQTFEVIETPIVVNGEVSAISGIGRDITQEVILEQKLWDTEEDRRSTLEFALRTSLGLVKGYVYTLESAETLAAEQRKRYTHIVLEEIDNLSKIVEDLLDYSLLEENSLTMEDQITDLAECVAMTISQYSTEAERRDIQMRVNIPENIPPIHLSPDALMRILTNLVQNAIHHTMHSGKIEVSVSDSDDFVEVSVTDNGIGISEKDLPYVFEKYYRGNSSANAAAQGAGLGLSVTKILVNALGGKIWATSKPGEKTEFRFVLPRRVGANPVSVKTEPMPQIELKSLAE